MGLVYKRRLTATQMLEAEVVRLSVYLRELWQERVVPSAAEISVIIAGSYIPTGSDGEGEFNGVPTQTDIARIIAGTFEHYEPPVNDFAIEQVPSEAEISFLGDRG